MNINTSIQFGCLSSVVFSGLLLFISINITLLFSTVSASLQIIPHFTGLPPSISQFVYPSSDGVSFPPLELVCRAWPANSKLHILAQHQATSSVLPDQTFGLNPIVSTSLIVGNPNSNNNNINNNGLVHLPQGLGSQRHAILSAEQITSSSSSHHLPNSDGNLLLLTGNPGSHQQSLNQLIIYETAADAIRDNPAATAHDEVAIRLIVSSQRELSQMELMKLHCLVSTSFGRKLSAPFRVLPATLGSFPPSRTSGGASATSHTENVEFLHGNIAIVDCYLPVNSYPKPIIQFELNNTVIDLTAMKNEKYRQITRADGKRVSLLIQSFQPRDCGIYRCAAINPLTKEKKYSPDSVNLKIIFPGGPVSGKIRVPMASESSDPRNAAASQEITVREGQNVSLFCIIQSAPPQTVTTYPFEPNKTAQNRFHRHNPFGLLEITNVQPSDAGIYICTNHQLSSTTQLRVQRRLRLTTKPQDVFIHRFGETVQFKCTSSNDQVIPYWLFNGQPKITGIGKSSYTKIHGNHNTLTITNVTEYDIGIYQCIAHRWDPEPDLEEWVSASAILAMHSDKIIRTAQELSALLPTPKHTRLEETPPEIITDSLTPIAEPVYDNLAVYMTWKAYTKPELQSSDEGTATSTGTTTSTDNAGQITYRVEYSMQISPVERQYLMMNNAQENNNNSTSGSNIENKTASDLSDLRALIGLVGYEAIRWSEPTALNQQFSSPYAYATGDPLEPGRRYRFRVIALDPSTGLHLVPPSGWSNIVSMEHISQAEPPQIKVVRPMSEGRIHVVWMFNGIGGQQNPNDVNVLSKSSSSSNNNNNNNNDKEKEKTGQHTSSTVDTSSSAVGAGDVGGVGGSTSGSLLFPNDLINKGGDEQQFIADHFLILARPVIKPKRGSGGSIEYGAYWATQVNGSNARDGLLTGLNNTANYQIIVYGVKGTGDKRQITRFSKAVYVNMASTDYTGRYSLLDTLNNNRLLYIILGGIAGLMFLVMFILILLCLCRQHQDRRIHGQRKKQNGYVHGYKDSPDFRTTTTDGMNNPQLTTHNHNMNTNTTPGNMTISNNTNNANNQNATTNPAIPMNEQGVNPANMMMTPTMMMMMGGTGNLQCSGMSEHSTSNNTNPNNDLQRHQMYMQQQHHQHQQQQSDPYATALGGGVASGGGMTKELLQQQRQLMLGSQLHLQQQQGGGGQSYMTNHSLHHHHPPHHQSHHSLLLPSVGASTNHMFSGHNNNSNNMVPPTMFHSGTLPSGPRYLRQQSCGSHYFGGGGNGGGSQQPLDRNMMISPTNAMEMTELYHHHQQQQQQQNGYAYQQPQLPPIPHPQSSSGLPPPYPAPSNTGTINRQMMANQQQQGYYPSSVTPSGTTSLKREPPTGGGGSLPDGSGYGTLLQRGGPLTASMMTDPSIGGGSGSVPPMMNAVYYRDSQQTLHMYPNGGMSTPQSLQHHQGGGGGGGGGIYQSHQQQQQQAMYMQQQQQMQQAQMYPGYFSPQSQQHMDSIGHGHHNFNHTDGESVYSYFSQQDMTQPAGHQHLNPLPEENQMNQGDNAPGYVDSGIQTADINGGGGTATDAGGSPGAGGGGSHRHHRRRRRKQSQQQQQQERQTGDMSGGGGSEAIHDSNIQDNGGGAGGGGMERLQNQSQSIRDSQMDLGLQKRQHALSSPGPYSDTDPMLSGQSNIPGLHSYPHNANGSMEPPPMSRYIRYDSPQRAPSVLGQLPPPNQPPPPPPPPAVAAMAFASNMNNNPDHNSMTPYQQHHFNPDSLSRHIGGGNGPSGGNYHPTTGSGSGTGLLVGPPPRIRDYSEYGIPRGIGLPPTPTVGAGGGGGQPQSLPQHNVLMSSPPLPPSGGAAAAVPSGVGGSMYYDGGGGHYHREGQA